MSTKVHFKFFWLLIRNGPGLQFHGVLCYNVWVSRLAESPPCHDRDPCFRCLHVSLPMWQTKTWPTCLGWPRWPSHLPVMTESPASGVSMCQTKTWPTCLGWPRWPSHLPVMTESPASGVSMCHSSCGTYKQIRKTLSNGRKLIY